MKKLKYFTIMAIVMMFSFLLLTSCKGSKIASPENLGVDIDNKLTWSPIKEARTYTVNIVGVSIEYDKDFTTRKPSYSLSKLDEGDYVIKVKAISDSKDESNWSDELKFHRDYESGCRYTLINNNSEYEITSDGDASGHVIIEDTYRGKPVTRIADSAFRNNGKLESVSLGKNIREIDKNAFYNCSNLVSINLPDSLKSIGDSAFQACRSLTSIKVPAGITEIKPYTFSYCRGLKTVEFSDNIELIGENAFSDCDAIENLKLPAKLKRIGKNSFAGNVSLLTIEIPQNLSSISENAFYNCKLLNKVTFAKDSKVRQLEKQCFAECISLTSIELPEGLEEIGTLAFWGCKSLANIDIPDSVCKVGAGAFIDTTIYTSAVEAKETFIYADNWVVGVVIGNEIKEIKRNTFKEGTCGIADQTFYGQTSLSSVILNSSIRVVGEWAFGRCSSLYRFVSDENSLTHIWDYAFYECNILSSVRLQEGLKSIGSYAFAKCPLLDNNAMSEYSFTPSTLSKIGTRAFEGTALWNKPDEYGVIYAGNWIVGFNNSASDIVIKSDTAGIANYAFYKCDALGTITGLNNAKYIGYGAFYQCTNLKLVALNRNLKVIEDYTFYKCSQLYNVVLPINLQSIGEGAFYDCVTLNEIDLSNTRVKTIANSAFRGCINIKTAKFSKELESIGERAFYKNSSLESVELPDTVTHIGERAFYMCEALTNLKLSAGLTKIENYTFYKNTALKSIAIPDSIAEIGSYAFYKCEAVESLTLGNQVKRIDPYAFYGLAAIQKLVLPDTLEFIGAYSFKGCNALESILLKGSVSEIEKHAFYGCKKMTIYTDVVTPNEKWHPLYNSSYRPVLFGCELSEDQSYVVAFTVTEDTMINPNAKEGIKAPTRDGYTFAGFKAMIKDEHGEEKEVVYEASAIKEVPNGTRLEAVWIAAE